MTCGDQVLTCGPNQSVYIPIGETHRLENRGEELLEIIEVQTGAILSEDDIERFDDDYGRCFSEANDKNQLAADQI